MHEHTHIPETSVSSFFSLFFVNFLNLAHPESALPEKQDHKYSAQFISACEDHVSPKALTQSCGKSSHFWMWAGSPQLGGGKGWRRRGRKRKQSPIHATERMMGASPRY